MTLFTAAGLAIGSGRQALEEAKKVIGFGEVLTCYLHPRITLFGPPPMEPYPDLILLTKINTVWDFVIRRYEVGAR